MARIEDRQLVIRMTDLAGPCHALLEAPWKATLSIVIPPGPSGRFFAGSPVGAWSYGIVDGERLDYSAGDAIVAIEPFTRTMGARVRGTVDLPRGGGAFEAELCALGSVPDTLPETVPNDPVSGTLDGHRFTVTKALIQLAGRADEPARLEDLRLFQDNVTCADLGTAKRPGLDFHFIGGAGSRRPLAGSAQPAWASAIHVPGERHHLVGRMPAWIRFDSLAFEPHKKVRGTLAVEQIVDTKPIARVGGRFEAEVCPR